MVGTNTFTGGQVGEDLVATIPEKWASMMLEQKFPEFVLTNHVTDLSSEIVEGDIIHVPNIYTNTFTVSTQAVEGTEVVLQSPTQVDVTITVNTQKYVAFMLGDKAMSQVLKSYQLGSKYAGMCQKVLLQDLESSLFGLYTSLTATPVGSTTLPIADLDFRSAIAYMEGINFKSENAVFMDNKVYFNQFIGLTKISPNYSSNLGVIGTGLLGATGVAGTQVKGIAYGVPIYTSTLVPAPAAVAKNIMLNKDAFAFGVKMRDYSSKVRVQTSYKLENLGTLTVADIIYGFGTLRPEAGIVINALNTGTVA